MSVQFEPVWSWWITLAGIAAMIAVTFLAYPRRIRHLPKQWRSVLIVLRCLLLLLLILMMLRPVAVFEGKDSSSAVLYILTDASPSMQTPDGPGGKTRRQALIEVLNGVSDSLKALSRKTEIRFRDYADDLFTVTSPSEAPSGRMTAHGRILNQLSEESGRARIPVILLLGDGRQAAAGAMDAEPVQAARLLGRQQRAIYSVGFGSTETSDSSLDLALDNLDVSREVFQGNVLMMRVRLRAVGAQGQPVTVRVLQENRAGLMDGTSGPMEPVPLSRDAKSLITLTPQESSLEQILQLQIAPQQTGDIKLAIEAEPLPGEVRRTNNRVETIIRVRRGGIRVAYFDTARPEQKWLREINVSSRIQLDYRRILAGRLAERTAIPDEYFRPGAYDGYIIGDVPATAFTTEQMVAIVAACNRGAGLMMTGGYQNFGKGGYAQSPLAPLFPVELPPENQQLSQPQRMLPARDSLSHYVLQIASPDQNRSRWEQLPPLTGANVLIPRSNSLAQVLATSDQGFPLLIGHEIGQTRVLAFAGDSTWRWYNKGFEEEHQRFWRQIVLWLTRKETDDEQDVWITATPRDLSPGQTTELSFGIRDADRNPVTDAEFDVAVTDPSGKIHSLTPRSAGTLSLADFEATMEPGDYWARVRASRGGQALAGIAITRFHVSMRDPELDNPTADFAMLRELSHVSGGEFLTIEQLRERLHQWAREGLPGLSMTRRQRLSLWDNWYTLLMATAFMVAEWTVRKKRGIV